MAFLFLSVVACGWGQLSALAVAIFAATVSLRQRKMPYLGGLLLSLGLYKPPLFLGYAIVSLLAREWRFLAGALTGGLFLVAVSLILFGLDTNVAFLNVASSYLYGLELPGGQRLPPGKGMGLLSAILNLSAPLSLGWGIFVVVAALLLALHMRLFVLREKLSSSSELLEQSSRITLSYFLSVQAINYDAAILLVPVVLNFLVLIGDRFDKVTSALIIGLAFGLNIAASTDTENGTGVSFAFCMVCALWLGTVLLREKNECRPTL